jgi:hypothetical protein
VRATSTLSPLGSGDDHIHCPGAGGTYARALSIAHLAAR